VDVRENGRERGVRRRTKYKMAIDMSKVKV
jgi:hypothetical protein